MSGQERCHRRRILIPLIAGLAAIAVFFSLRHGAYQVKPVRFEKPKACLSDYDCPQREICYQSSCQPLSLKGFSACGDQGSYFGEPYPTVMIGRQCWLAKNLDIGTMVMSATASSSRSSCQEIVVLSGSSCQKDDGRIERYCYGDIEPNCAIYGGLYEWHEALRLPAGCTTDAIDCLAKIGDPCCPTGRLQGICPDGWHIPTNQEWQELSDNLGGYIEAGKHLKTSGHDNWNRYLPPDREESEIKADGFSGFAAIPGGFYIANPAISEQVGLFSGIRYSANFWSSSPNGRFSWYYYLSFYSNYLYQSYGNRGLGLSVRCVKD